MSFEDNIRKWIQIDNAIKEKQLLIKQLKIEKEHYNENILEYMNENELENAKSKLVRKNCDMLILNSLNDEGAGFNLDTNKITILDKNNKTEVFTLKSKTQVAEDICNKILNTLKL